MPDGDWEAVWLTNVAEAKALALAHNRPILAVFGSSICAHCDNLDEKVLHKQQFLDYAAAHQLVLFHCRNYDRLRTRVADNYRKTCGMTTLLPHIYLFKVKPGADLTSTATTALDPDQVSLLEISSGRYAGTLSGTNYANASINGVRIEAEANWTPATFIKVLESYFPNKEYPSGKPAWNSLVPPAPGPGGYENAEPLGVVPTKDAPPENEKDWILTSARGSLSGVSSDHWYKFTGAESRHYVLGATGIDMTASAGIRIKVAYFRSDGVKPLNPAIKEVTSNGWDAFDRGIWLDSPEDTPNQLYFLRISHSGGNAATNLDYTLKLHQAAKNPAVGALSNPYWQGALLGKWTMDVEAAIAAAWQNNRPVIFCFSGVRWCRFCVGAEHTAFANPDFNAALNDAYLVLVDNRRRNDTGPSLLRENFAGGYLTANGIAEATAEDKLAANLLLQNALALPGASEAGWTHGPRISYPTFVYCRVAQTGTRADVEIRPIGRFGYDANFTPTEANEAVAVEKLEQLKMLDLNGYLERSMFAETSQQELAAGASPFSSYIGGLVTADWVKFSVDPGKSFLVMIRA
ncbi:MAG: DUF255 domain-containing protein, partial [Lentisphaerae bacterium]|nr:DUF255 domain-containing protein [Lentisphaerota bacterium]